MFNQSLPDGLPETFREPSGMRLLSYLLTGLLKDLPTEEDFTAYGAAYGIAF
jgi:hypothetical protein